VRCQLSSMPLTQPIRSPRPVKTGLLEIAKIHKGDFRITANQNLIIAGVPESEKAKIEKIAKESGLMNAVTPQRENSMAC
ncbi:hypothetical protein ACUOCP_55950, partial [Escherichia sp. R-CC3]